MARVFLDNIKSIQASWVTQGPTGAQVSLRFGVNDFGSTVLEENVVSAAGGSHQMDLPEMIRLIEEAGFEAIPRDTNYKILEPPTKAEIEKRWNKFAAPAEAVPPAPSALPRAAAPQ